jgi:hypothetical protein
MWFEELVGFREDEVDDVAALLRVDGPMFTSLVNGRTFRWGSFELVALEELRSRAGRAAPPGLPTAVREIVADVGALHRDPTNAAAVFQVASQFNALEMVSPDVTPEDGVERYEDDHTQGPACAVACGAGTIHRNHLVPVGGRIGQTSAIQLDGLADLAAAVGIEVEMRNGYAFPTATQLDEAARWLAGIDPAERDRLAGLLRVGLQAGTEVTAGNAGHLVDQVYCSALPVAYSSIPAPRWEPLARLVLDAAYEATLAAAVATRAASAVPDRSRRRVHLTLLGGGVFGNPIEWIVDALDRALGRFADAGLDVVIVSHAAPRPELRPVLDRWGRA